MRRSIPPLLRPAELGGVTVTYPLRMGMRRSAAALIPVPRRLVAQRLEGSVLRPAPVTPTGVGLVVSYRSWEDSPVGAFDEIVLFAMCYHGRGSPVPGLAAFLHGVTHRSSDVGELGYVPLLVLVDQAPAVGFRRDLWQVPVDDVVIRARDVDHEVVVQAEHRGSPILRLTMTGRHLRDELQTQTPLYGPAEPEPWHDLADASLTAVSRRYRWGCGQVAIYPGGPLMALCHDLDPSATTGYRRRALAGQISGPGTVRLAGPRPVQQEPDEVLGELSRDR